MQDNNRYLGHHNLRGLIQDLSEYSDILAHEIREKTVFAGTSQADAKTFMLISRHPRGITDLAKALNISRQAAHKSVRRLVEVGVVSYELAPGSRRDRIARITDQGLEARKVGLEIAAGVERNFRERIGEEDLETLRSLLMRLLGRSDPTDD